MQFSPSELPLPWNSPEYKVPKMSKKRKVTDDADVGHTVQSRTEDRRLYCVCRQPDDPNRLVVQCDFCDEWFHPSCIGLEDDDVLDVAKWHCPSCIDVMSQNPMLSTKGLLGFQGRVAPSTGWNDCFPIEDIDERVIFDNVETKRHRTEGWTLFREGRITSLCSNTLNNFIFLQSQCQAAMRQKSYTIYTCFKDGGRKLKWATCSCPAGIDGKCKHVVASLYFIIDMCRQDIRKIPDIRTCTDRLQMWHVRRPLTDEPLLFSDIEFVKHDPEKPVKRDLCAKVKFHDPIPECHKNMSSDTLRKLYHSYNSAGLKLPVLEVVRDNGFIPVATKQQSDADLHMELFSCMEKDSTTVCNLPLDALDSDCKQHFTSAVQVDINSAKIVEKNTRLQSKSAFWFEQREYRLTSSTFGSFCRMRQSTDPVKLFSQKRRHFTSKSVRHGINYESQAFAKYLEEQPCQHCPVGLMVNPNFPFLAASPDRLVKIGDQLRLVEIKCPFSLFQRKTKIRDQLKDKTFYLDQHDSEIVLKRSHDYFYQIQGQLNVTGINSCDLVVYVPPDDILTVNIKRDTDFFNNEMLPCLQKLYFEHLLPHFVQEMYSVHA